MLRPASPELLDRLLRAVHDVDVELDTALTQLGVLPPLDLGPIRAWLMREGTDLEAGDNPDGHRIIHVSVRGRATASIGQDGRVVPADQTTALASALATRRSAASRAGETSSPAPSPHRSATAATVSPACTAAAWAAAPVATVSSESGTVMVAPRRSAARCR